MVFRCKSGSTKDYYSQMNADIFEKWFVEMLVNLEESYVVVMNNAFYHFTLVEDFPKANTQKTDVQKWHEKKN